MDSLDRSAAYRRQTGRKELTPRQWRRWARKHTKEMTLILQGVSFGVQSKGATP